MPRGLDRNRSGKLAVGFFPQLFLRLILTVLADRKFTVKGTVDEMRVAVCFNLITLCQMKYLFLPCQPQHCLSYLNQGGGPRLEPSISHYLVNMGCA